MGGFFVVIVFVIIAVVVLISVLSRSRDGWKQASWSTSRFGDEDLRNAFGGADDEPEIEAARRATYASVSEAIAALRGRDEEFSLVLFEDFLYALFAEVHTARGERRLDRLAPYLSDSARRAYESYPATAVRDIVIGSMKITSVASVVSPTPRVEVTVEFEANYTEVSANGAEQTYYAAERWQLGRSPNARSRSPEKSRVFGCPNCGAPLDQISGRTCSYCQQTVDTGEFDWLVHVIDVTSRETRGPMLTGTVEEVGTDLPTVVAPDVKERYQALARRDPAMTWQGFLARVETIFREFQVAWSAQEPMRVRPYLSDSLFQFQLYWVAAYKRAGLRNVTEGARITTVQLARVVSDKHFDALTVRVYASSVDYTIDGQGHVVGGNKTAVRSYSEYWTLIRGSGRTGAPRATPECPSCGAPLDINMTGHCGHCRAKVTSGEFDWVLSRIEQDEAYG